jgi:hypothetical protein
LNGARPIDTFEKASEAAQDAASRLNMTVAVTVALLATFIGICKVKDDNIVQAMQQSWANKLDHWAFQEESKRTLPHKSLLP